MRCLDSALFPNPSAQSRIREELPRALRPKLSSLDDTSDSDGRVRQRRALSHSHSKAPLLRSRRQMSDRYGTTLMISRESKFHLSPSIVGPSATPRYP